MRSLAKDVKEDMSIEVIERMFAQKERMRIVIAPHSIHGKASSFVPYLDLSEALTCPPETIYSIISRSERVKRYCGIFIMKTPGGIQPTLCISEEGIIHVIDILNQHIESLSGQKVTRCRQLTFNFSAVTEVG
ncbi:MAG: hypothetical protein E3K29_03940 [Candidatus Brocadia sp.]|nr:hypothetical protein [Candidatus Brocadia sp.]